MLKFSINSTSRFRCLSDCCCGRTEISKVLPKPWLSSLFLAHLSLSMSLLVQKHCLRILRIPSWPPVSHPSHLSQAISSWLQDSVLILASRALAWGQFGVPCIWIDNAPESLWLYVTLWFSVPLADSVWNSPLWFLPMAPAPIPNRLAFPTPH